MFINTIAHIPYTQALPLRTGDILATSTFFPFIYHYAIFYNDKDGVPTVADNALHGQRIQITPYDTYTRVRNIIGVVRNDNTLNLSDQYIQEKISEAKNVKYNFFDYNCEDFVRSICGCYIGTDQRIKYMLLIIVLLSLFIIFFKMKH